MYLIIRRTRTPFADGSEVGGEVLHEATGPLQARGGQAGGHRALIVAGQFVPIRAAHLADVHVYPVSEVFLYNAS